MPRDKLWHVHKNDPNWPWDEDGFAKDTPKDHPSRIVMQAIDVLTGDDERDRIARAFNESDFTDEFTPLHPEGSKFTVERFDGTHNFELNFRFSGTFQGRRYQYDYTISRLTVQDSIEEYQRARAYMYREVAHRMRHDFDKL